MAADISGELGWLPDDLYQFLPLFENQSPVLYAGKYPVTNIQYDRFLKSPDFGDKELWCEFPKFDENSQPMKETWEEQGWQWLQEKLRKKRVPRIRRSFIPDSGKIRYLALLRKVCQW